MRAHDGDEQRKKEDLDRRELAWFKENYGWAPPEGADIDKWLGEMREHDENGTIPELGAQSFTA